MSDRSLHDSNAGPWKSLDTLAGNGDGSGEFTEGTTTTALTDTSVSRRGFMTLVSASMALTAAACRRPEQKLVPTVKSIQTATPGLPLEYATTYTQRNVAYGAVVRSREGRPVHVKGNAIHPSNCGTASAEMQATLLSLYDPDRIRRARLGKGQASYDSAVGKLSDAIAAAQADGKQTLVFVDDHASPSLSALFADITTSLPSARFITLPAIVNDAPAIANTAALGIDGEIVPDLGKARVIVCVDADPLGSDPLATHHTGRWAAWRTPTSEKPTMNTMIVAEAQYSLTGANADRRVRLHPSQLEAFLAGIEKALGMSSVGADLLAGADAPTIAAAEQAATTLKGAGSEAVVLAGRHLSPRAHGIALAINSALGSVGAGKIVDPVNVLPNSGVKSKAIDDAVNAMMSGSVGVVVFANVNPEYSADRRFKAALAKVPFRAAINLYEDETATVCNVSIPAAHWLESWGDAVAFDGTLSVRQPLIAPLNEGIPSLEDTLINVTKRLVPTFLGETATYHDYVKARWVSTLGNGAEGAWIKALQDGVVIPTTPRVSAASVNTAALTSLPTSNIGKGQIVLTVPSLALYDGAYANNGWLMELPDPVTKITWDNVALISPAMAVKLGLAATTDAKDLLKANEKVVTITTEHGGCDLPVWVQVGMADDVIVTQLGYGHTAMGGVARGAGVNVYPIATPGTAVSYTSAKSVQVVNGARYRIATTQNHHTLDDGHGERPVAKWLTLGDIKAKNFDSLNPHFYDAGDEGRFKRPLSIVNSYEYRGHRWGMVIDMSQCTGCSSCVVACQSENNISVVGKDQVLRGREMQWIRLDRYYTGDMENPASVTEPMLCQHCENAPCENVCPVAATTHSPEGLNEMTYNRCVGTRYCLNNCPYKVRRFNFLNYNTDTRSPLDLAFNPDVTVRMRGIMEKCTFCVQRLHEAKWHARDAGRARVLDGEARTACQEACPAGAIIFGDTNDKNSRVSKARNSERGFRVLAELNVRPQVTYLARVSSHDQVTETAGHGH